MVELTSFVRPTSTTGTAAATPTSGRASLGGSDWPTSISRVAAYARVNRISPAMKSPPVTSPVASSPTNPGSGPTVAASSVDSRRCQSDSSTSTAVTSVNSITSWESRYAADGFARGVEIPPVSTG